MEGAILRDEGMTRAVDHADAIHADWSLTVYAWLQRMATKHVHKSFTTEELRASSMFYDIPTAPDARTWGQVMRKAAKAGLIVATGEFRKAKNPFGHCRDVRVWRFP